MDFSKKKIVFFILAALLFNSAFARKFTVSGFVKDAVTHQVLAGANVFVPETMAGVVTDSAGFYSISLQEGEYLFLFSFVGFERYEIIVTLYANVTLNVEMGGQPGLEEVVVSASPANRNIEKPEMSTISVNAKTMRAIPAFFGETDLLRTVQLMPGVQSAGDGNTGFFVRGGNADQNLVLFDGAVVYNASHLFNFFSVFNPDAVEELQLYKGGIPPSYAGRLSSVLDVTMKEGNMEEYEINGGIGLISSRLSIEGPVQPARSSFMISGRRTYADLFLNFSSDVNHRETKLHFYDLNAKMNYVIDDRNRLFLSGYSGRDITAFGNLFGFDWGNATGSLRWNRIFSERFSGNLSLLYSNYQFNITGDIDPASFRWKSQLYNINLKTDFTFLVNELNTVTFGLSSIYHNLDPGNINASIEGAYTTTIDLPERNALEYGIYLNNETRLLNNRVALVYGLRTSLFQLAGPGRQYLYDKSMTRWEVTDTIIMERGKFYDHFSGWEPRVSIRVTVDQNSALKASYNRMIQYIQQAQSSQSIAPYDVWYMSSNNILPQQADQFVLGYFRNFLTDRIESSLEFYYKDLKNISDVIDNGDILGNEFLEGQLRAGKGWSYGLETLVRKNSGRLSGFIGYTWAITKRQIDGINNDKAYFAPNDKRHDLSLSGIYELTPSVSLSANFLYSSGRAFTLPSGKLMYQGAFAPIYEERNSNRLPVYNRMDLSVTWLPGRNKRSRRFESSWNFSVFNVYGRVNPISVSFAENNDNPGIPRSSFFYIPGPIPSVTWNFSFK